MCNWNVQVEYIYFTWNYGLWLGNKTQGARGQKSLAIKYNKKSFTLTIKFPFQKYCSRQERKNCTIQQVSTLDNGSSFVKMKFIGTNDRSLRIAISECVKRIKRNHVDISFVESAILYLYIFNMILTPLLQYILEYEFKSNTSKSLNSIFIVILYKR